MSLRRVDHIQFRRSVASGDQPRHYQIDVIQEKFLPTYLGIVEAEFGEMARLLDKSHDVVRAAIDAIADKAKTASPDQLPEIMELARQSEVDIGCSLGGRLTCFACRPATSRTAASMSCSSLCRSEASC